MAVFKIVKGIIRRQFLSGVLVVVPLILTYIVLRFLFESIDGILSPILSKTLGYSIPGLGIITTILIILLTGFFMRSIVGKSIYKKGDRFLAGMPVIRIIYLAAKQLINAVTLPHVRTFKEVVMIEYMRKGLYAVGFATTEVRCDGDMHNSEKLIGVFVPSTPTPVSGILVFVPEKDIFPLNISVEEAVKLLVSGGIVSPGSMKRIKPVNNDELEESYASGEYARTKVYN